jgi:hypothetical protein
MGKFITLLILSMIFLNCGNKSIGANKSIQDVKLSISKEKEDSIIAQLFCTNGYDSLNSKKCMKNIEPYDFERYNFNSKKKLHYYFISRWEGFVFGGVFVGVIGCFKENSFGEMVQNQPVLDYYCQTLEKPLAIYEKIIANQMILKSDNDEGQEINIYFDDRQDSSKICCTFEK